MILFDLTNPLLLVFVLFVAITLVVIAKYAKNTIVASINLFIFLALIIVHVLQFATITAEQSKSLVLCIAYDFIFILLTFIGYLWVDDLSAKEKNKKSVDNSLDWFWDKL